MIFFHFCIWSEKNGKGPTTWFAASSDAMIMAPGDGSKWKYVRIIAGMEPIQIAIVSL